MILLLAAVLLAGSTPDSLIYHGRMGHTAVHAVKTAADIRIDGRMDEPAWQQASLLTGFSEYAPVDKLAAEDSTEVYVLYTDHELYVGIRAFETHGSAHATLADRDKIGADDYVQLFLDTFHDRRRALTFAVNALGVQADGLYSENGNGGEGATDLSPDFLFQSKGRITPTGYEVELRIPFKTLRYQSSPVQTWGLQALRGVQHSGHRQTWTNVDRGGASFIAQAGTLDGLTGLKRGLVVDVNPVVTDHVDGSPDPLNSTWRYKSSNPEFGGNVRWGVTENLTLNATVNPDFSQVESDVSQIQFDPRQAQSFPEKRPFFLEGNENFSVNNGLIYTRDIVAPVAAAKFTGKVSGLNIGVLSAVDNRTSSNNGIDNPVFNIIRMRRDVGRASNIGLVYTDRIDGNDYNRVAGLDSRIVRGPYTASLQYVTSFTRDGSFEASGAPLAEARLNRSGRTWGFVSQLGAITPDFVAASGFIPRTGIGHAAFSPRRTWYGAKGAGIEQFQLSTVFDGVWDYDRFKHVTIPNDFKWHVDATSSLRGGWRVTTSSYIESFKYPPELYTNYFIETRSSSGVLDTVPYVGVARIANYDGGLNVATPAFKTFNARAVIIGGRDENFDEWSRSWILFSDLTAEWRPTDKLRVNAHYVEQRTNRVSDRTLVSLQQIPRVKIEYQLSRPTFVRFVGQYTAVRKDSLRDDSRTEGPILVRQSNGTFRRTAATSRSSFRADMLFAYQPNPGTVVFAGYGSTLRNPVEAYGIRGLDRVSDGFFVKVSYLFRL